jgi:hypothetical protein
MAVELRREDIVQLMISELGPRARYRALVVQSSDISELDRLAEYVLDAASALGPEPRMFDYSEFFDDIGAISCNEAWSRIQATAGDRPVVLAGPLHFLDYWSDATRDVFWRTLSSFSCGPGIVVIDAPRNEGIEGPFRLVGRIGETDVRLLRSRLSASQDRVA